VGAKDEILRYFGELLQTYREIFGVYPSQQALRIGLTFEKLAYEYLQRKGYTCFWVSMCPAMFAKYPFMDLLCVKEGQCYIVLVTGRWGKVHPREVKDACYFSRDTGCKILWVGVMNVDSDRVCIGDSLVEQDDICDRRVHYIPGDIRKKAFRDCEVVYLRE